ncbi:MAG TPA: phosphotransferase [Candidatus Dormibacteraeota bacterium]|nr:phosphotransferase [Candidatus Dormibacteraeota bacterium]
MPAEVRAATEATLGGEPVNEEFAWMSWAGTVWRVRGRDGSALFVKRAADLTGEKERLAWLAGRWPVPELVGLFHALGDDWLVTRALPGVPMFDPAVGWEPARVATTLGEILQRLHATDATGCPFGVRKRGHVLIHGDYCLPNVLVDEGRFSAVVDVGLAGLGNPETDLAAGVWTLQYNYGKGFARPFLEAYGWPPMSDEAIEKLRRRYAR